MNKENSNLKNKIQPVFPAEIDKLAKSVSLALGKDVIKILNEISFKIKIENSIDLSKAFNTQVKQISKSFESYSKKAPTTLPVYLQSINERANDFQEMLGYIKSYPLKSITNQLKDMYVKEDINYHHSNNFMYEISKSITNLVVDYSINFEEILVDRLSDKELLRLNPSYYIKNQALQTLSPDKYNTYKELLYKGVKAFYLDFKAYVNVESNCFKLIEKFFLKLIHLIEELDNQVNLTDNVFKKYTPQSEKKEFPDHIFKSWEAFLLFNDYAIGAKTQDEIGFLFRQMTEKETPSLIKVKETVFRKWFNEHSKHSIELSNQVKTYDRIGNKNTKQNLYNLMKSKYNFALKQSGKVA